MLSWKEVYMFQTLCCEVGKLKRKYIKVIFCEYKTQAMMGIAISISIALCWFERREAPDDCAPWNFWEFSEIILIRWLWKTDFWSKIVIFPRFGDLKTDSLLRSRSDSRENLLSLESFYSVVGKVGGLRQKCMVWSQSSRSEVKMDGLR